MTYVITEACIDVKDKSCVEVCPVDCIYIDDAVDRMCFIDPDACTDCTLCESACPVGAIFADSDLPAASQQFLALNEQWFQDREAARAAVNSVKSV